MTIDIRATVTCSLGELISGSISDSYVQAGLVTVSGNCTIKGLLTPAIGEAVTFSYTRDGVTTQIPRQLRVLSFFADPFRDTTEVQLGCKLTYLNDVRPLPEGAAPEDPEDPEEPSPRKPTLDPRELNCRYPDPDFPTFPGDPNKPGNPSLPGYMRASALFTEACTRLGLASTGSGLTAKYYVDKFDFSGGYVGVISQLLATESKFGFINASGALEVRNLESGGGEGPVVDVNSIIDIAPVGVGELVPGKVVVRYNSLRLKPLDETTVNPTDPDAPPDEGDPEDPTDDPTPVYDNWERTEVVGTPVTVSISYRSFIPPGNTFTRTARYIPYSETITEYGAKGGVVRATFNNQTCEWEGGSPADFPDLVTRRETRTRTILAAANGNYCTQLLGTRASTSAYETENLGPQLDREGWIRVVETFEYNSKGDLVTQTTENYEPYFMFVGRLDVPLVFLSGTSYTALPLNASDVLVQRTITRYENIYGLYKPRHSPSFFGLFGPTPAKNIELVSDNVPLLGQKVVTETWVCEALIQNGQQAIAEFSKQLRFNSQWGIPSGSSVVSTRIASATGLRLEGIQQQTTYNRIPVDAQGRPNENSLTLSKPKDPATPEDDTTPVDVTGRIENQEEFEVVGGSTSSPNTLDTSLPLSPDDVYNINGTKVDGQGGAFAREYGRCQLRLIIGRRFGANLQLAPDKVPAKPYSPLYLLKDGLMVQYRANGTTWAFSADGVAAATDALLMGITGGTGTPWVPVTPGVTTFPPLPDITDGTTDPTDPPVPPVTEKVKVYGGIRLAMLASSLPYSLNPDPVYATLGLRVGVYGTRVEVAFAESGVALGAAATGLLRTIVTATPGIALASDITSIRGPVTTVPIGIKVGLRGGIDPEYEYVLALLRMNGQNYSAAFTDESRYARSVIASGDVYTDTAEKKYGTASASFNIVTPYGGLLLNADPEFALGTSDFTIEAWVRNTTLSGTGAQVLAGYGSTTEGAWQLLFVEGGYVGNGPYLAFQYSYLDNTNTLQVDGLVADFSGFPVGVWRHISFVRSGTSGVLYVDGTSQTDLLTGLGAHDFGSRNLINTDLAPKLSIGFCKTNSSDSTYADFLQGRVDDFRITRGIARYTANFTPPAAELPAS